MRLRNQPFNLNQAFCETGAQNLVAKKLSGASGLKLYFQG